MNRSILLLLLLPLLCAGCKKEETTKTPSVDISVREIALAHAAGRAEVALHWAYAEWELQIPEGEFLSDFTFKQGGSVSHAGTTRIHFNYAENNTGEERQQELIFKNRTTGVEQLVRISQLPKPPLVLALNTAVKYQTITGFGGMLNPAIWLGDNQLTEEEVERLYGQDGLGFKMMRMMIYANPSDWNRDLAIAKKAQSLGARIFASPWTPPAHMKSSKQQAGGNGGYLLPEYYQEYVEHLNAFVDYMTANGVTIEAVSIQNEPDWDPEYDACVWNPEQILAFMKDYAQGIKVKVIAAEAVNFKKIYTDPVLNDPIAVQNLDIVGTHLYGGGIGDYPLARQHGKEIWMTEHLHNNNSADDWSWENALMLGEEIYGCMNANFNAYIWWYLKRHYSVLGDGLYGTTAGEMLSRGFIMSHYAKYTTGRQRIAVEKMEDNGLFFVTAYEGEDDITLVVQNSSNNEVRAVQFDLPQEVTRAEAIETTESSKMANKSVVLTEDKNAVVLHVNAKSIVSIKLTK
ncbi:glycoside hydrolase [Sphingobacterium corticibacterium]|uniref:Glycosyl hydrolase family 30 TIM-barrel domain-containing protein n=1 Tax=Sphingobacterium corticibacterium TaxID=2484746 RepID=A0A4Q6XSP0_9SPHI|nr:hypothetical protein [Sphingobacterium corticibacterium]RZF59306.1 hypothetical protein EWE74_08980 [Sphingobacterium corticibacterium]